MYFFQFSEIEQNMYRKYVAKVLLGYWMKRPDNGRRSMEEDQEEANNNNEPPAAAGKYSADGDLVKANCADIADAGHATYVCMAKLAEGCNRGTDTVPDVCGTKSDQ